VRSYSRASFVGALQRRVDVSELKVRVSEFRLIGDELSVAEQWPLEILVVDISLSFIQKSIERLAVFASSFGWAAWASPELQIGSGSPCMAQQLR